MVNADLKWQELVINKYEAFFSQLLQDTSGSAGAADSVSYKNVWDVERFIGWSNEVFDVGKGILGGGMHSDDGEGEGLGIVMNEEEGDDGYADNCDGDGGDDGGEREESL